MTTKHTIAFAALILIAPAASHASWFEFCDLRGAIRNVEKTDDGYAVIVSVTDAARSKTSGGNRDEVECPGRYGGIRPVRGVVDTRAGPQRQRDGRNGAGPQLGRRG